MTPLLLWSALALAAPSGADADATEQALREELDAQRAEIEALRGQIDALRGSLADQQAGLDDVRDDLVAEPVLPDGGEKVSFGGRVVVEAGERVEEAVAFGEDVEIHGHVAGDATSFGADVRVRHGGVVDGDAVSFGGRVIVDEGGVVNGDRVTLASGPSLGALTGPSGLLSGLYDKLVFLLSLAGAGVLVVGLFPDRVGRVAHAVDARPIRSGLVGVVASVLLVLAAVLFAITLIGLPVSLLLAVVLGLAWLVGFVGVCQAIGDRLPFADPLHGRWAAFAGGVLLVTFAGALPLGWPVAVLLSAMGVGAALSTRYGGR